MTAKLKPTDPSVVNESAFQIEVRMGQDGKPKYRFLTPESVTGETIKSPEDLQSVLSRHQHNMIPTVAKTVAARRWHMERYRPALRHYCRKFNTPVPKWLEGNHGYDDLSPGATQELFGDHPLRPQEFKTWGELFSQKR